MTEKKTIDDNVGNSKPSFPSFGRMMANIFVEAASPLAIYYGIRIAILGNGPFQSQVENEFLGLGLLYAGVFAERYIVIDDLVRFNIQKYMRSYKNKS